MDEAGSASAPAGAGAHPPVGGIDGPTFAVGERQLRTVLDNSPVVSFIADARDRVVYQNEPGRNRCGAGRDVLGRPVAELLPQEHVAGHAGRPPSGARHRRGTFCPTAWASTTPTTD